jgi:hypothetical protein
MAGTISNLDKLYFDPSGSGIVILPKTAGAGSKFDPTGPVYGWKDIIGEVHARNSGAAAPTLTTYRGNIQEYQMDSTDYVFNTFHIPHDYVPGTDIYIHVHWSHISAAVTGGSITWQFESTYAKGYGQGSGSIFAAPGTITVAGSVGSSGAGNSQYEHQISEVQLSAASPTGGQLDSDNIEVDGIIMVATNWTANNLTGATPNPFIHFVDLHYQATFGGTKGRNATGSGFYG